MDLVRFENHGSSNTIWPEASRTEQPVVGRRGRDAYIPGQVSLIEEVRKAQARKNRSKSRIYPRCHQDRKAQKLLDRINKMLHAKGTNQNSLQAASPKQSSSTGEQESSSRTIEA